MKKAIKVASATKEGVTYHETGKFRSDYKISVKIGNHRIANRKLVETLYFRNGKPSVEASEQRRISLQSHRHMNNFLLAIMPTIIQYTHHQFS